AQNTQSASEMLDLLVAAHLDINYRYPTFAVAGNDQKTTLLGRAIEKGNLPLTEALLRNHVRTGDPIQTYGMMGFTIDTYPLASAVRWQQIGSGEALVNGGADVKVGNYAAYREALRLRQKPILSSEEGARVDALIPRLAPTGSAKERTDAELRLETV